MTPTSPTAPPPAFPRWAWPAAALLGAVTFLVHLPFLSRWPVNWDAAQFVLATRTYDLDFYQPHPPGYLLYVLAGRTGSLLTGGDANLAFSLLSAAATGLAVGLCLILAVRLGLRGIPLGLTVAAVATSPVLFHYGGVALTYALEAAGAALFGLLCWHARERRSAAWWLVACVLLGLAGGVRQTTLLLLLPLWAWAGWTFPWRLRLAGLGLLGGTVLAWLLPLVALAGGPETYLATSRRLATDVMAPDGRGLGAAALAVNLALAGTALLASLGVAAVALVPAGLAGVAAHVGSTGLRPGARAWFLLLWTIPALLLFGFVHIGQPGYMLLVLPPVAIGLGLGLQRLLPSRAPAGAAVALGSLAVAVALLVPLNQAASLQVARAVDEFASRDGADPPWFWEFRIEVLSHVPLYGLRRSTTDWDEVRRQLEVHPPGTVTLLTSAGILGSGRMLDVLFPQHPAWGIWMLPDRGYFFPPLRPAPGLAYDDVNLPQAAIPLPPGTTAVVVIDDPFVACLDLPGPIEVLDLGGGNRAWRVPATAGELRLTTDCLGQPPPGT